MILDSPSLSSDSSAEHRKPYKAIVPGSPWTPLDSMGFFAFYHFRNGQASMSFCGLIRIKQYFDYRFFRFFS